jgi:hypothetical protein
MRAVAPALLGLTLLAAQASAATIQPYVAQVHAAAIGSYGYLLPTAVAFCGNHALLGIELRNRTAVERLSRSTARCNRRPIPLEYVRVIDGPHEGAKGYMRAADLVPAPNLSPAGKPGM